jgi:hypothetical protein
MHIQFFCLSYRKAYKNITISKGINMDYLLYFRELRLIEALQDPHICDKILQYNVHKEREGSLRFAKGQSETFQTLHNLV